MNLPGGTTGPQFIPNKTLSDATGGRDSDTDLRWYAVYTWPRHEKTVARSLEERGLAYFLPLYQAIHRWNMRSARVSLPLFPGYVFVHTGFRDRFQPLRIPGVVHYVSTGATPAPIPDEEIDALRRMLVSGKEIVPHPYLSAGNHVRIAAGPLAGLCGVIERTKAGRRFIVTVEMIKRSIAVELDACQIESMQLSAISGQRISYAFTTGGREKP